MREIDHTKEFATRYRKIQIRLSIGVFVFVIIMGIVMLGLAVFFLLYKDSSLFTAGIILIIAALLDCYLGYKFIRFSINNNKKLPDRVCAKKYSNITGKKIKEYVD